MLVNELVMPELPDFRDKEALICNCSIDESSSGIQGADVNADVNEFRWVMGAESGSDQGKGNPIFCGEISLALE